MKINHIKTGTKVKVKYFNDWLKGTIAENEYVKDKYISLSNGDELFDFEITDYKVES